MASVTKRPDGTYRARYRAPGHDGKMKEYAKHFPTKKAGQAWLDEVTASRVTGTYIDPDRARSTVAAMATTWLASHPDWTPSTRARNESVVAVHVLPRWGAVKLADVTHEAVQEWVGGFQLAGGTVRKILGVLNGILELAVTTKRLAVNPAVAVARPKQTIKRRRYLNAHQVERLAHAAGDAFDVVMVLAYSGLRFGELAALRVGSVDQLRRRFRVEESVTEVNGVSEWGTPKDHQRRSVPYPDFLDDHVAARMADKGPNDLLFPSARGGVLRVRNLRRGWFDAAAVAAGVEGLTPHELRHTAASLAVKAGASVLALQRMLGHDKPSTTLDVYADLFDEDLDDVAARLATVRAAGLADFLRTEPRLVAVQ
ncbi:site-specific integrase [Tessaracoccus lubricantis]|uniref:Site-specific integrase n=1 Tax=Tessaracoccus lubricantis TaxID=545543 RepID=A0ABP9EZZ7_9ACTN